MIGCFFSEAFFCRGGAADTFDCVAGLFFKGGSTIFALEPRVEAMGRLVGGLEPEEAALEPEVVVLEPEVVAL